MAADYQERNGDALETEDLVDQRWDQRRTLRLIPRELPRCRDTGIPRPHDSA
jgi:hypothetical protein